MDVQQKKQILEQIAKERNCTVRNARRIFEKTMGPEVTAEVKQREHHFDYEAHTPKGRFV